MHSFIIAYDPDTKNDDDYTDKVVNVIFRDNDLFVYGDDLIIFNKYKKDNPKYKYIHCISDAKYDDCRPYVILDMFKDSLFIYNNDSWLVNNELGSIPSI